MYRLLAYLLCSLLLFQTLEQELLVVNYELNQARITARYCVNKARPQLKCNGKCHLAKQLRSAADEDEKAPAGSIRLKFELVPAPARLTLAAPRYWPAAPGRYAAPAAPTTPMLPPAGCSARRWCKPAFAPASSPGSRNDRQAAPRGVRPEPAYWYAGQLAGLSPSA